MNNINSFNSIIEYIERNITSDIDISVLSQKAQMSVYEFRRIFTFVAGVPVSEYIRKRRLSLAAEELLSKHAGVTETAIKYGYDNVSSFSRAFKEFHGFSPNSVFSENNKLNMFTKIGFNFGINGGSDVKYNIVTRPEFYIIGISGNSGENDTECCENVWNKFYENDKLPKILQLCSGKIFAAYENGENGVKCTIGAESSLENNNFVSLKIPASKWASFEMHGADDNVTNEFYNNIILRWLTSSRFSRNYDIPNIEIFPENMESDDFSWKIEIPIKD